MSFEPVARAAQIGEGWLRGDGLPQGGGELAEQSPAAGRCQAAAAGRGESPSSSTSGSSSRIIKRCARI